MWDVCLLLPPFPTALPYSHTPTRVQPHVAISRAINVTMLHGIPVSVMHHRLAGDAVAAA